jgi:EAL domain-containing protein (putative c-di-GMP-specific phosphodiesterase class I)
MYRAKSDGRARHAVFDSEMHARAVQLLQVENELRQAVAREEFEPWFMPVVSLTHGRIWGFEALVRWRHPQKGVVVPAGFVNVAEDAGLIVQIDRLVMRQAWRQLREWREKVPDGDRLVVGVNLSVKQFHHGDLVDHIKKVIEEEKLPPGSLAVEITENVLIDNSDRAGEMLRHLRSLGILVYLDDFGTGYSSLSYLQRFPIDAVKIDRSFVDRMSKQKDGLEIVRAIVQLAHSLGMKVIAEGVEVGDQLASLRQLKCGYGQGYLFSKPVPADEAGLLLAEEPRW